MDLRNALRYLENELRDLNRSIDAVEAHLAGRADQQADRCKAERPALRRLKLPISLLARPQASARSQWRIGI
jgi:hypothetical protein